MDKKFTILTSKVRIEDDQGKYYILGTITDISDMKFDEIQLEKKNIQVNAQKKEIESLVREVHHHTEQSLQIITKVTSLLVDKISDAKSSAIITDLNDWIDSLISLHQYLYSSVNVSSINLTEYIENLSKDLLTENNKVVDLVINAKPISLELKYLMPIGLVINELLLTCQHAFGSSSDSVRVEISVIADHQQLRMKFTTEKPFINQAEKEKEINAVDLIKVLVDHMNGELNLDPNGDAISLKLDNIRVTEKTYF